MTMQADQLMGAQVTGSDGQPVGTVDRVFRDDMDGTPSWVRIRSGKQQRLVPLSGGRMTTTGLSVPFDVEKIAGEPAFDIDKHMSAGQEEELRAYFGLTVPSQRQVGEERTPGEGEARLGEAQADRYGQATPEQEFAAGGMEGQEWLILTEERVEVATEVVESGRVRLHKYVDTEPIERVVHVFREEYEVEQIPIPPGEQMSGAIDERDQELILHEEHAVFTKENVPVERVRLSSRRVEEDRRFQGEIHRDRIEIEANPIMQAPDQAGP